MRRPWEMVNDEEMVYFKTFSFENHGFGKLLIGEEELASNNLQLCFIIRMNHWKKPSIYYKVQKYQQFS